MSNITRPHVKWSNIVDSFPVEDLRQAQKSIGDKYGIYGDLIRLNNNMLDLIRFSYKTKEFLNGYKRISDIESLLWTDNKDIFIIDDNMRDGIVVVGLNNDSRIQLEARESVEFIELRVL